MEGGNSLKDIKGKVPYHLVPPHVLEEVALGFGEGADKYEPWDWLNMDPEWLIAAVIRHLNAIRKGEAIDPDTGLHHASKAATGCMMVAEILRLDMGGEPIRAARTREERPQLKIQLEVTGAEQVVDVVERVNALIQPKRCTESVLPVYNPDSGRQPCGEKLPCPWHGGGKE
jgi:hypothetical protein